jgi:hypothetical protein
VLVRGSSWRSGRSPSIVATIGIYSVLAYTMSQRNARDGCADRARPRVPSSSPPRSG